MFSDNLFKLDEANRALRVLTAVKVIRLLQFKRLIDINQGPGELHCLLLN